MDPIKIISTDLTYVRKFRMYGNKTIFQFNEPPTDVSEFDWLRKGFANIVEKIKSEASESDQIGFVLQSLNLKSAEPGYIAFQPASSVHADILWQIFGGIIQSNADSVTSADTFKVECTRVNQPLGTGRSGRVRPGFYNNFYEECKSRRGIISINNTDNLCLPRALVVAKAYLKKDPQCELIRKDKSKRQTVKAHKLMHKAQVEITSRGAGIPELEKFQNYLHKYNITVYNYDLKGREVYFEGQNAEAKYKINLLFHEGHFNVIRSLTAAFACAYYCEACHVPYEHRYKHRCTTICSSCYTLSPPCIMVDIGVTCQLCNRYFKNQTCFDAHQGEICNNINKCPNCKKHIFIKKRKSQHVCGELYCTICDDFKAPNHKCYMRVDTRTPKTKDFLFIFFDFETRQDEVHANDPTMNLHKVNLCVAQQFCYECINGHTCLSCSKRTHIFKSDPVKSFMDYVMEIRKAFKDVCVIAHNGQGFDFQFTLKYLLENTKFTPNLIMRGTKVILMEIDNVRFIDSLNYFPMALSALPKAFELPPEKKKGYFPHLFNTLANQSYVGPMPSKEYYCPESMFKKGHDAFEIWYNEQVNSKYEFNFQEELLAYCISDVDILAQACIKFRNLLLNQCNVDPFLEAVTIASACNLAFRRNFLKPNTIGLIPKNGYRGVDNQSAIALQWLTLEEDQRGVCIQHSGRGREIKIQGMKVDGFDGERVYEFQGCYYHGCPKCYPNNREDPLKEDPSDSLHLRYERTKIKMSKLSKTPYEIVETWECQFRRTKSEQKLTYLNSLPILNTIPLDPRDSFFGGRTGNTKTYHKCEEGETIQYVDVCSLYPYVCKYGKYPISHPNIYVGDKECRQRGMNVEGLIKCRILPPQDLYHPVLPTRMNDKLMFVLCSTCGEEMNGKDCDHNIDQRALTGTWTMDEVRMAVKKGYVILSIYELWEYKMATFENGGLFTEFINKFVKIKQEASGYPAWCKTQEDKEKYVLDYLEHEDVQLDPVKIEKNGGLRSLAKLMLNSFWGKFGQRENQTKTSVIRSPKDFFRLFTNPGVQVNTVQLINEEVVMVNWQNIEELGEASRTANVVIAAYTTAQARLKLYDYLDSLGEQVFYYDTDSAIYLYREGLYRVPTAPFLGEMTDELAVYGSGSYIIEFVSGGPKTYAYRVWSTKTNSIEEVCKIKGLTLNLKTSRKLNFDKLKDMVLAKTQTPMAIEQNRIRRTRDRDIVTVQESKIFKITGPKRKHDCEYDTLPYGYKKLKL